MGTVHQRGQKVEEAGSGGGATRSVNADPKNAPPPPHPAQAPPLSSHHYLVKLSFMDLSI